jgi:hypothetical protein
MPLTLQGSKGEKIVRVTQAQRDATGVAQKGEFTHRFLRDPIHPRSHHPCTHTAGTRPTATPP